MRTVNSDLESSSVGGGQELWVRCLPSTREACNPQRHSWIMGVSLTNCCSVMMGRVRNDFCPPWYSGLIYCKPVVFLEFFLSVGNRIQDHPPGKHTLWPVSSTPGPWILTLLDLRSVYSLLWPWISNLTRYHHASFCTFPWGCRLPNPSCSSFVPQESQGHGSGRHSALPVHTMGYSLLRGCDTIRSVFQPIVSTVLRVWKPRLAYAHCFL